MGSATPSAPHGLARTPPKPRRRRPSLADALFSTTRQRVLGLLFGQPDRSFFATEIIKRAGSGSGSVQRELARLAESGLISVSRIGNQKHYQANNSSPLFHELRGIVRKTSGLAEPIRDALTPLVERLKLAVIYGSVAKGTDRADSDIDLLLVADDVTLEEVFAVLAPVEIQLGRTISPTLYTDAEVRHRRSDRSSFLRQVLDGEHLLLIGEQHDAGSAR
jgi:predicted nucleotidyltransferase